MKRLMIGAFFVISSAGFAQEPVVGVANPEALFKDANPKRNRNKLRCAAGWIVAWGQPPWVAINPLPLSTRLRWMVA